MNDLRHPPKTWVMLLLGLFCLQVLVPAGYMPSPLSQGSWVRFCPTGLTSDQVAWLHKSTQAPDHNDQKHSAHNHASKAHHLHLSTEQVLVGDPPAAHVEFGSSENKTSQHHNSQHHSSEHQWPFECPYGALSFGAEVLASANGFASLSIEGELTYSLSLTDIYLLEARRGHLPRAPPFLVSSLWA